MTDLDYDIIDELYFSISLVKLKSRLGHVTEETLKERLLFLAEKGWVKFIYQDTEEDFSGLFSSLEWDKVWILATKNGLLAHNTI